MIDKSARADLETKWAGQLKITSAAPVSDQLPTTKVTLSFSCFSMAPSNPDPLHRPIFAAHGI